MAAVKEPFAAGMQHSLTWNLNHSTTAIPLHIHIHAKGVSSGSFSAINLDFESKFRVNLDLVESSTPRGVSSLFVVQSSPSK